jgi:hypothetical protein
MTPEDVKVVTETIKILGEVTASKPNEWLPVYAALGGAVAGAIASFFPTWMLEKRREASFSKQIESCLVAEISSLLEIIDQRNYFSGIKDTVEFLRSQPEGTTSLLTVEIPAHYSRVYQENCKNIGVVEKEKAKEIIIFHQLVDAVVQDLKPDGPFSSGAALGTFEEMERIFEKALCIGRKLTDTHNKSNHADL